jgi:hypothetical protein
MVSIPKNLNTLYLSTSFKNDFKNDIKNDIKKQKSSILSIPIELIMEVCSYFETTQGYSKLSHTCRLLNRLLSLNINVDNTFHTQISNSIYNLYSSYNDDLSLYCFGNVPKNLILNKPTIESDYILNLDKNINDNMFEDIFNLSKLIVPKIYNPVINITLNKKNQKIITISYYTIYKITIIFDINSKYPLYNEFIENNKLLLFKKPNILMDSDINSLCILYYKGYITTTKLDSSRSLQEIQKNILNKECHLNMELMNDNTSYNTKCKIIQKIKLEGYKIMNFDTNILYQLKYSNDKQTQILTKKLRNCNVNIKKRTLKNVNIKKRTLKNVNIKKRTLKNVNIKKRTLKNVNILISKKIYINRLLKNKKHVIK